MRREEINGNLLCIRSQFPFASQIPSMYVEFLQVASNDFVNEYQGYVHFRGTIAPIVCLRGPSSSALGNLGASLQ